MPSAPSSPALEALLARRPEELRWLGPTALSGFFFAVCAAPELIKPSEWMELVFGEDGPEADTMEELQEGLEPLFAIYNEAAGLARGEDEDEDPALPPWIEIRPAPEDNLRPDTPLAAWSKGFRYGHEWLELLWDVPLPEEADEDLSGSLACLIFFGLGEHVPDFMEEVFPGDA